MALQANTVQGFPFSGFQNINCRHKRFLGGETGPSQCPCLHKKTRTQKKTEAYIHARLGIRNHDRKVKRVDDNTRLRQRIY
jgi:hypothetical protein